MENQYVYSINNNQDNIRYSMNNIMYSYSNSINTLNNTVITISQINYQLQNMYNFYLADYYRNQRILRRSRRRSRIEYENDNYQQNQDSNFNFNFNYERNQESDPNQESDINEESEPNEEVANEEVQNQDSEPNQESEPNEELANQSENSLINFESELLNILDFSNVDFNEISERNINNIIENNIHELKYEEINNPVNDSCPISQEDFTNDSNICQIKYCKHNFNKNALVNWLKRNHTCPMCRYNILTNSNMIRYTISDDTILILSRQEFSQYISQELINIFSNSNNNLRLSFLINS